jgi:antibiotic biosynthesis monooxygenase (ABM) superfamily enzyme
VAPAAEFNSSNLLLCARIREDKGSDFTQWRARLQTSVLNAGAVSFEYLPPAPPEQTEAVVLARFQSLEALRTWRLSDHNRELIAEAEPLVEGGIVMQLAGAAAAQYLGQNTTTEVIITDIKPGMEELYRRWFERIQKVQETFPGYLGSFVQPPQQNERGWTTVIRFDTPQHLDDWINSKQRSDLVNEGANLILGFHAQRVDTSFPGWAPVDPGTGKPPNMWKTASLVLLTLFPVIMLELKFLNPHTRVLPPALGTFIGNAISVALTTWPLMPLAIRLFHPYLFPDKQPRWLVLTSPLFVIICYAIEIAVLWHLL